MWPAAGVVFVLFASVAPLQAQDAPTQSTVEKRGWIGRVFHPFSSERLPDYKDARLRGLVLELQVSPQPVTLSETRHLDVRVTLSNRAKHPVTLEFPTEERIDIWLLNSAENVLTKWSDNHAFAETPGTILINPQEHVDYVETIATRDLTPNKVFICEVFFPKYPELRVRQKLLAQP